MENIEIARVLRETADLLEIQAANPFRIRAYRNAVRTIESQTVPMRKLVEEGANLTELPAIGKGMAENMGTEALVAESIGDVAEGLVKIPRMLSNMEQNTAAMARSGIKLHPNTIQRLGQSTEPRWYKSSRLYIVAITILTIALFLA